MAAVHRQILSTAAQFRTFVDGAGRPRYAITTSSANPTFAESFLQKDEWVFSDDLDALMQAALSWKARGCRLQYEPERHWRATGLPAYFSDAAAALAAPADQSWPEQEDVRIAFFLEILKDSYSYGFFDLDEQSYDAYLEDWERDDQKKANPQRYRDQKHFGVITDLYGSSDGSRPMRYFLALGEIGGGYVSETQLRKVEIEAVTLLGQTCVVNGLDEVEMVGNRRIPTED
jgi:hypothetical protein